MTDGAVHITFQPRLSPEQYSTLMGKKTANAVFVKVHHNGKVIHENVECTGPTRGAKLSNEAPTGPILLQGDHGHVAYRNLKLIPQ